jgi:hypothetical protein
VPRPASAPPQLADIPEEMPDGQVGPGAVVGSVHQPVPWQPGVVDVGDQRPDLIALVGWSEFIGRRG